MIKSLKAFIAGSAFIIIVILLLQLLYIFLAVGYNNLAHLYPFLNELTVYIKYLLGIPVFLLVIFFGGLISAAIAVEKPVIHGLATGLITSLAMILPTLENAQLTTTGALVIALSLLAGGTGGLYWKKSG